MLKNISQLPKNQEGATAVEYGLIMGILAVVIVLVFTALGGGLTSAFDFVTKNLGG